MTTSAFLDTCVLVSSTLTMTLLDIAESNIYLPFWSADVLQELEEVLINDIGVPPDKAARRIQAMGNSFQSAKVTGYDELTAGLECHPDDRHVLAAAIRGQCGVLVTFNKRDFPSSAVRPYQIEVTTPDDFLLNLLKQSPGGVQNSIRQQVLATSRPPLSFRELLDRLDRSGVPNFAAEIGRMEMPTVL